MEWIEGAGDFMETAPAEIIASMGVFVAAIVGGYCAFLLLRKGLRWLNKIG